MVSTCGWKAEANDDDTMGCRVEHSTWYVVAVSDSARCMSLRVTEWMHCKCGLGGVSDVPVTRPVTWVTFRHRPDREQEAVEETGRCV